MICSVKFPGSTTLKGRADNLHPSSLPEDKICGEHRDGLPSARLRRGRIGGLSGFNSGPRRGHAVGLLGAGVWSRILALDGASWRSLYHKISFLIATTLSIPISSSIPGVYRGTSVHWPLEIVPIRRGWIKNC